MRAAIPTTSVAFASYGAGRRLGMTIAAGTTTGCPATNAVGTQGSEIRGSATYKGAAAGKYAMASTTDDSYEGGHFTAMATLMVDFDAIPG